MDALYTDCADLHVVREDALLRPVVEREETDNGEPPVTLVRG